MEFSYQSMKVSHHVREADEMKAEMRKKSLLVLIYEHLLGQGYVATAAALERETNGAVRKFEVCDNVDLEMMLLEFESYHYIKFQKYPKVVRKVPAELCGVMSPKPAERRLPNISSQPRRRSGNRPRSTHSPSPVQHLTHTRPAAGQGRCHDDSFAFQEESSSAQPDSSDFGLNISSITGGAADYAANGKVPRRSAFAHFSSHRKSKITRDERGTGLTQTTQSHLQERLLKPLGGFSGMSSEMSELAAIISRDIHTDNPSVRWDDIIGLEDAKQLVKEAVVYPIKYPQLFTGLVSPWKALLLYGPPDLGKTLLARAVATECRTTFFNISASSIISKWRGDSEKLVRVLFGLARYHAPSTIFLDELESVMSHRVGGGGELDQAMLRRLDKRILVGLPSSTARCSMISHWLPPRSSTGGLELRTQLDYQALAQEMDGYSGSDVRLVCKEAAMRSVRKVFAALEARDKGGLDAAAIRLEAVTTADFLDVISHTKPSCHNLMDKYASWGSRHQAA
uniref:Katanin p60 ATPase-containing subunit A-like 2 n=1 Tax=Tetraodon nigroviridis TaxID=99883 RepID=H3CGI6_TETNG